MIFIRALEKEKGNLNIKKKIEIAKEKKWGNSRNISKWPKMKLENKLLKNSEDKIVDLLEIQNRVKVGEELKK